MKLKPTALCNCGTCNDAADAAIKLFVQMNNGHDCSLWITMVSEFLVLIARAGAMANGVQHLIEESGATKAEAVQCGMGAQAEINALLKEAINRHESIRKAIADIVCGYSGEHMREDIMRTAPDDNMSTHTARQMFAQLEKLAADVIAEDKKRH